MKEGRSTYGRVDIVDLGLALRSDTAWRSLLLLLNESERATLGHGKTPLITIIHAHAAAIWLSQHTQKQRHFVVGGCNTTLLDALLLLLPHSRCCCAAQLRQNSYFTRQATVTAPHTHIVSAKGHRGVSCGLQHYHSRPEVSQC